MFACFGVGVSAVHALTLVVVMYAVSLPMLCWCAPSPHQMAEPNRDSDSHPPCTRYKKDGVAAGAYTEQQMK